MKGPIASGDPRIEQPHWVYRLYDGTDDLLYVGCTSLHPTQRIRHLIPWNRGVKATRTWKAELYPDRHTARAWEGELIDLYDPPLNAMRAGVAERQTTELVEPIARDLGTRRTKP